MKRITLTILALSTVLGSANAQAEDIRSILARQAETPSAPIPTTIPYSYTFSIDATSIDGKKTEDVQAVLRIDPSQPAGSRAQILSASDPESDVVTDLIEEFEDPEKTMEKQAEGFWCGRPDMTASAEDAEDEDAEDEDAGDEDAGDEDKKDEDTKNLNSEKEETADPQTVPADFEVLLETPSEAVIRPSQRKMAEILIESNKNADKNGRKMMEKLAERMDGYTTLSKPDAQMKGFKVSMTRPLTMMIVAKLKTMDMEQNCALAPNGFYHLSEFKVHVDGKAVGKRFGQNMTLQISELTPLPQ